jgi:hypothetical protein
MASAGSIDTGSDCAVCGAVMCFIFGGIMLAMFYISPGFTVVTPMFYAGWALIALAVLALIAGYRPHKRAAAYHKKRQAVYEIAGVARSVTISGLSERTGIDPEMVHQILTRLILSHSLYGYIEDDVFVRDTSGPPRVNSAADDDGS